MAVPAKLINSGGFQDPLGTAVTGSLTLRLSQDAKITATDQVAPKLVRLAVTTGDIASTAIWFNDELTPSGTFYTAEVFDAFGTRVYGPQKWELTGAGPIDLGTISPLSVDPLVTVAEAALNKLFFGQANKDVELSRESANRLKLAAGDAFEMDEASIGILNSTIWVDGNKYAKTIAGINQAITDASIGDTIYLPRGSYTGTGGITIPNTKDGLRLIGSGSALTAGGTDLEPNVSSGAGLKVEAERVVLAGFSLRQAGTARTQVGLDVGDATNPGHFIVLRELSVTNFDEGVRVQNTQNGSGFAVDSFANGTYNWHLTNTANSNNFSGVNGRGTSLTDIGLRVDDTTANSSSNRFYGGTFEGNLVEQVDIVGADYTMLVGTNTEPGAASALTGTVTLTNGSTAMSGSGTAFNTELKVGQYVKLNADANTAWMRVASITDATNAVLSDQYQGTGGSGAASKGAGNARVVNGVGTASFNYFLNTNPGAATPVVYFQSGTDNRGEWVDAAGPVLIGSGSTRASVRASNYGGGLTDLGASSIVEGDPPNRHYMRDMVVATASLPAASAAMNGTILIEDAGAGDRNLIIYAGGQRFRIDGGAAV